MQQLNIDIGVEEFQVNGRGILRFNPGDPNLYHRFFDARETLAGLDEELARKAAALEARADLPEEARAAERLLLLAEYDGRIKALLTGIFGGENDFDSILEGVNLAGVGTNGRRVVCNLLDALTPVLQEGARRTVERTAAQAAADAARARAARGA